MADDGWNKLFDHTIEKYGYGGRLNAFIELLKTRNYETGKVTQSIRSIAERFGITKWAATRIVQEVEKQARTAAGHKPDIRVPTGVGLRGQTGHKPDTRRTGADQDLSLTQNTGPTKYSLLFEKLWPHYPKNNGTKKAAYPAFKKAKPNELEIDDWIESIKAQKAYKVHMDSTGQFCPEFPFLQKWIKEERWTNKPVVSMETTAPEAKAKPYAWVDKIGEQENSEGPHKNADDDIQDDRRSSSRD